jgi:hypothetical protein
MPIVDIPPDLENIATNSSVPGVAAFIGSNGEDRAYIYIGLILDGVAKYNNISEQLPHINLQFFARPYLNCSTDITFNPSTATSIAIKVLVIRQSMHYI